MLLSQPGPEMLNSKNNTKSKNIYCTTGAFSLQLSVTNTTSNHCKLRSSLLCKGFIGFHLEASFLVGIILALEKPFFLFFFFIWKVCQ